MSLLSDSILLYRREMLVFRSNIRTNLMRSIIFPLVIIIFFGNIGSAIFNVPVTIVNYANNPQSRSFISTLQSNNNIKIYAITDQVTALGLLKSGKVQMVLIILPTFPSSKPSTPGIQLYYSNTQFNVIGSVITLVSSTAAKFGEASQQQPSLTIQQSSGQVSSNALYASKGSYKDFVTAGIFGMVVVFTTLFGGGISFISDKQLGNIKTFLITPISKNAIVASKIMAGATFGLISALIALVIGLLNGVRIAMYPPLALLYILAVVLLLGIGFSSIAMIIASRLKKVDAYAIFAQAVGLPLWFIGGGIIPIASLPSWLSPISTIDPLTYANDINRAVVMQGFIQPLQLLTDLTIIGLFSLACAFLSFKVFKSTIE